MQAPPARTPGNDPERDHQPANPGTGNIAARLSTMAGAQPEVTALKLPTGGDRYQDISYRQLDRDSATLARGLRRLGVCPGERVVLMVPPGLEFFSLVFALFRLGAVLVAVDPGMGVKNLGRCLAQAEPGVFIGTPRAHLARILLGWARSTLRTRILAEAGAWPGLISTKRVRYLGARDSDPLTHEPDASETAAILFTSGSTGPPKGVIYTHANFTAQVEALRSAYDIRPGEIDLATFPLFALFAPALGMTSVLPVMDFTRPGRVRPENITGPIRRFGVTNLFGSPALLDRVGRGCAGQSYDGLPSLRRVLSAGAPVSGVVIARFQALLAPAARIHTPYGATESLPVCSIDSGEILAETAHLTGQGAGVCIGQPLPGIELRIIGISDEPIPAWRDDMEIPGTGIGEIVVRGPQVTAGYFNLAEETRRAKIRVPGGGFFHRMGDLGYRDEQGRVWFCGRKSQRVQMPGATLYTIPCEGVFNTHPDVYRTALIGIPGKVGTEAAICVELEPDVRRPDLDTLRRELLELGERFSHTRIIRRIFFHPGFPVDIRHNAKIDRERLARWAGRRGP